ncbi:sugar ABC transporter substrate-binding protein [Actinoplanes sichuanensis]|uniref:Extracellular solute-binding protein n=1 Tax=Actinoplanes sichuanensis TaxID=512349 RepID=A0ABW4AVQ1_9ACTN|nr:extracellular solute-binding protein [Actinoplanes sichuanensis]BEL04413.1 sugar ABC transporter substrate-binding protein [Actinoplanes sichuanensis]
MTPFPSSAPLSRRSFLGATLLTAGAVGAPALAGCTTGGGSGSGSGSSKTVTVMFKSAEFTKEHIAEFEKLNPGLTIEFIEDDPARLKAMMSAGSPPDFVRGRAEPLNVFRGLVEPLDPYIDASSVLKRDDLLPINDNNRWDGKTNGTGKYYSLIKDWSPDACLWQNTALFEKAKIEPLSTTEPISWDELLELGKKLTVRQDGKTVQYGLGLEWAWSVSTPIRLMVAQQGGTLFNADMTEIDFTSPAAQRAVQWYTDFGRAGIGPTVLNPLPDNADYSTFAAGKMAITKDGFWFGGNFAKAPAELQKTIRMAPAATFGTRMNMSYNGGMGAWIPTKAKNKDGAWKVMEYFMSGPPAVERAKSGWGLPALKSLWQYIPQELDYQKEAFKTAQAELEHLVTLPFSPYATADQVKAAIETQMTDLLKGNISVPDACVRIQDQINKDLKRGKELVG